MYRFKIGSKYATRIAEQHEVYLPTAKVLDTWLNRNRMSINMMME
jgi:hypothetical protein